MKSNASKNETDKIDSRMPLWVAITANAASVGLALRFFGLSDSDWVRPMGWAVWTFASELNAVLVLPLLLFNLKGCATQMDLLSGIRK
jgi:hypothetical protein